MLNLIFVWYIDIYWRQIHCGQWVEVGGEGGMEGGGGEENEEEMGKYYHTNYKLATIKKYIAPTNIPGQVSLCTVCTLILAKQAKRV